MAKKVTYNANSIEIFQNVEHVRKRPSIYIYDTGMLGAFQLVQEVVSNVIDEWLTGNAKSLKVTFFGNLLFRVEDDGRGIPIDIHKKTGKPALTTIFTILGSGGKFDKKSYDKPVAGLNGCGVTVVNALSSHLKVWTKRDGKIWHQLFSAGNEVSPLHKSKGVKLRRGTIIEVALDPSIFSIKKFTDKQFFQLLETTSYLCPKLKISYVSSKKKTTSWSSDKGLLGLLTSIFGEEYSIGPLEIKDPYVSSAFGWKFGNEGETWNSYVNVNPTPDGGVHVEGAKLGIAQALLNWCKGSGLSGKDLREGLVGAIHVLEANPKFVSQSKVKLSGEDVKAKVKEIVAQAAFKWFKRNVKYAKTIINRAKQIKEARAEYRKARTTLNKLNKTSRNKLPAKLDQSPNCSPSKREIYICEGDSAGGTATRARDPKYQEILPLRGKIPNAVRMPLTRFLENEEIKNILQSVGGGFGPDFDLNKVRVGKVMLLADGDPDGCFIGSTRIRLADGTAPTLEELSIRYPTSKDRFQIMSLTAKGTYTFAQAHSARVTRMETKLLRVTISSGDQFVCTENHPIATRTGHYQPLGRDSKILWVRAKHLNIGTVLCGSFSNPRTNVSYIEPITLKSPIPVYDLSVDRYSNFELDNGTVAHNSHIASLLIVFFLKYTPKLIEDGRIYVVNSPLFMAEHKDSFWYGNSVKEVKKHQKAIVTRLKGHGSAPVEHLKAYAFSDQRSLTKITIDHAKKALSIMSDDVDIRKELLGIDK